MKSEITSKEILFPPMYNKTDNLLKILLLD